MIINTKILGQETDAISQENVNNYDAKQKIWKKTFKKMLIQKNTRYRKNSKKIQKIFFDQNIFKADKDIFQKEILNIVQKKYPNHHQQTFYGPIVKYVTLQSELKVSFPYASQNEFKKNTKFQASVRQFLKQSQRKDNSQKIQCWKILQTKWKPKLQFTTIIQLYKKAQKYGIGSLKQQITNYCSECNFQPFIQKILSVGRQYLQPKQFIYKQQNVDQMTKSIRKHFCLLCLIYGCFEHSQNKTLKQKNYMYERQSKTNKVNEKKIQSFKTLIKTVGQIQKNSKIQRCGNFCYKIISLTKYEQKYQKMFSNKFQALMEIGISIFLYDPCKIASFLSLSNINCSQVYNFLIKKYLIFKKVKNKFFSNQLQKLQNQLNYQYQLPIRKISKKSKNSQFIFSNEFCCHNFKNELSFDKYCISCLCSKRGYCFPSCLCSPNCTIQLPKCNCQDCTDKCSCLRLGRECLTDYCQCSQKCKNKQITNNNKSLLRIGQSSKGGLGVFAGELILQGNLVSTYLGQLLRNPLIESLRDLMHNTIYTYVLSDGISIDARYCGNKSRFFNHSKSSNILCKIVNVDVKQFIAFYAKRNLQIGEQLFVDYDGTGSLVQFYDKYPFLAY